MSMKMVKEIMAEAGSGFLATTDGEKASVRPMGAPQIIGSELWFATAADSAKVGEIRKRNRVEFCIADKAWRFVRIAGVCTLSLDKQDRQKYLDLVPMIKDYFKGADDPNYAVLRIRIERMRLVTQEGERDVEVGGE